MSTHRHEAKLLVLTSLVVKSSAYPRKFTDAALAGHRSLPRQAASSEEKQGLPTAAKITAFRQLAVSQKLFWLNPAVPGKATLQKAQFVHGTRAYGHDNRSHVNGSISRRIDQTYRIVRSNKWQLRQ